jgi:hypothetical protein
LITNSNTTTTTNNKEIELMPTIGLVCWNICPIAKGMIIPPIEIETNNIVYALEECDFG